MKLKDQETKKEVPVQEPPTVILENWYRVEDRLEGNVYNHPNPQIADGEFVTTSPLVWIREDVGLAKTRNTNYILRNKGAK